MDYPLTIMSIFWHFLKLYFSGLKIILFFSRKSKNNISDLISPKNTNKKNFYFWTKTMDYPLRKMSIFFDFLKLQFSGLELFFLSRISRNDLFEHNQFKNTSEKNFQFWAKTPWTNLLGKGRFFGPPQNAVPFWSKNHSFLSKISKTISSDLIIPKKPNEKKFDF